MAKEDANQELLVTREQMIELLNEDLSREYQAVIAYFVYSQKIKGAVALSERLRGIMVQEQEHEVDLCDALGINVPAPAPMANGSLEGLEHPRRRG